MRAAVTSGTRGERGLTLIELIIAILVLSTGTLAVIRTLDHSQRQIGEAPARYLAQSVAANRAAELRLTGVALGRSLPGQVRQGPYDWQIGTTAEKTDAGLYEVTLSVTGAPGPGAQLVVYTTWGPAP